MTAWEGSEETGYESPKMPILRLRLVSSYRGQTLYAYNIPEPSIQTAKLIVM